MRIDRYFIIFAAIVALYALFSSSTPDEYGLAELLIGIGLVFLVGVKRWLWVLTIGMGAGSQTRTCPIQGRTVLVGAFLFLIMLPSVVGLGVSQSSPANYVRDFIPLLYLFLPLLLLHRTQYQPQIWFNGTVVGLCIIGILYSFRHFYESSSSISEVGKEFIFGTFAYYAHDPAVSFAAAFLVFYAYHLLVRGKLVRGGIAVSLAILPLAAILSILARAPIGLILLGLVGFMTKGLLKKRERVGTIAVAVIVGVIVTVTVGPQIVDFVSGATHLLLQKNADVGLSSRDLEVKAVLNNIGGMRSLLVGEGWGGLLVDPIYSGLKVRFTHNIFTFFLLKTGVLGLIALLMYLAWIGKCLAKVVRSREPMVQSVLAGIIVSLSDNMLLQPGFKTLSIGLILMLPPLLNQIDRRNWHSRAAETAAIGQPIPI